MLRSDFSFELPGELIAQEPLPRGTSRMMVVHPMPDAAPRIEHRHIADIPHYLRRGDLLVLNDTQVIPARIFAAPRGNMQRSIEVLLTRQTGPLEWESWCRPARRVRPGDELRFSARLTALVAARHDETFVMQFAIDAPPGEEAAAFWEELDRIGAMPLPPYIQREQPREEDRHAYQTVYAAQRGAVAAPTAGLHFTRQILQALRDGGVEIVTVTLHVGIGTFKPVKVERVADHRMDAESYELTPETAAALNAALEQRRRIVAVGTTSVRTLESAIRQGEGRFEPGSGETRLFITPGFEFAAVELLLTNFHLPESTLLMLVSAFAGVETIREVYRTGVAEKYRFYSFGDCMLLHRRD
jgi:S-adenosylmethionine:tRNA ribosyltransferase-isomerase